MKSGACNEVQMHFIRLTELCTISGTLSTIEKSISFLVTSHHLDKITEMLIWKKKQHSNKIPVDINVYVEVLGLHSFVNKKSVEICHIVDKAGKSALYSSIHKEENGGHSTISGLECTPSFRALQ